MTKKRKPAPIKTLVDVVLPAGTEVSINPPHQTNHAIPHVTVLVPHGKDSSSEWHMPLEDAVALGIVEAPAGFDEDTYNIRWLRKRMAGSKRG